MANDGKSEGQGNGNGGGKPDGPQDGEPGFIKFPMRPGDFVEGGPVRQPELPDKQSYMELLLGQDFLDAISAAENDLMQAGEELQYTYAPGDGRARRYVFRNRTLVGLAAARQYVQDCLTAYRERIANAQPSGTANGSVGTP